MMQEFAVWLGQAWSRVFGMLDHVTFNVGGTTVSYLDILVGLLCLAIVCAVFWKGARA